MDTNNVIIGINIGLVIVTIGLLAATVAYSWIAWLQYRGTVDPRIVIYPELRGEMVTIAVENRGGGCACDIRIRPDQSTRNFYDTPLLQMDGTHIPVVGPGQRCVFIWSFWTHPENAGESVRLSCSFQKSPLAKRVNRDHFSMDPNAFAGASIGLSKAPATALAEGVQRLIDAIDRAKPQSH